MKKFLAVLGAVFLVLLFAAAVFIGCGAYAGGKLDASSKAYVDESVPAIVSGWSKEELIKRASSQLREKASDDQITQLFNTLSNRLGAFQSYDGAKGDSNMSFTSKNGCLVTASYVAKATFQHGKADIQIRLIQSGGAWKILNFHVEMTL